jgi:hypothetical protein
MQPNRSQPSTAASVAAGERAKRRNGEVLEILDDGAERVGKVPLAPFTSVDPLHALTSCGANKCAKTSYWSPSIFRMVANNFMEIAY